MNYESMLENVMFRQSALASPMPVLYGFRVDATEHCQEFQSRWIFPERRFVEFEKHDEGWARRLGFGHEVQERIMYKVGNILIMHPKTLEALIANPNLQTVRP